MKLNILYLQGSPEHGLPDGGCPPLGHLPPERPGGLQPLPTGGGGCARGGDHLLQVRQQLGHASAGGRGEERGQLHHAVSLHECGREAGPHRPVHVSAMPTLPSTQDSAHHPAGD